VPWTPSHTIEYKNPASISFQLKYLVKNTTPNGKNKNVKAHTVTDNQALRLWSRFMRLSHSRTSSALLGLYSSPPRDQP
jgi:hypothetical protein